MVIRAFRVGYSKICGRLDNFDRVVSMATLDPVGFEIIVVYRENLSGGVDLRSRNHGRIGEIHRMILISLHQFEPAHKLVIGGIMYAQAAAFDKGAQLFGSSAFGREYVKGFCQYRKRRRHA